MSDRLIMKALVLAVLLTVISLFASWTAAAVVPPAASLTKHGAHAQSRSMADSACSGCPEACAGR